MVNDPAEGESEPREGAMAGGGVGTGRTSLGQGDRRLGSQTCLLHTGFRVKFKGIGKFQTWNLIG